ncbi:MAG: ParB N-terminal domain-containing protein [Candidatus Doudnabacteria bacterium]|nr:ParB N-terminal domain-containing protein [Candidatus Doudnabacteria bacterium]
MGFPILITKRQGRWLIIDGVHRLVKAHEQGWSTIQAKVVGEEDIARFPSEE